jgi:choline kinase
MGQYDQGAAMQGVILAAGIGSRLRPLTNENPKCLIEVLNKPILEYQLNSYKNANVKDVIVVVGYLYEKIEEYFEANEYPSMNIQLIQNRRFECTNNMYSLWIAKDFIDNEFILSNGDVIFDPLILSMMFEYPVGNLVACDTTSFREENMKIKLSQNQICKIRKDISQNESFATTIDIYKIGSNAKMKLFDIIYNNYIQKEDFNQWTEVALQDLFQVVPFYPFDIGGRKWIEIDTFQDLEEANILVGEME